MAKEMRKVRTASVVRTRTDQTATVEMEWKQRHRLYRKQVRRVARFYVHDPGNRCQVGDTVRIQEVRPLSRTKRWRLLEIVQRRQVAQAGPVELEPEVLEAMAPRAADRPEAEQEMAAVADEDTPE